MNHMHIGQIFFSFQSGNVFTYFSNLDKKVIITRRYDNDKGIYSINESFTLLKYN